MDSTDDDEMTTSTSTSTDMNTNTGAKDQDGGRKRKGTRKINPALKSWVTFVKKVQHEEKITYPEAMKRASKRKSEWKRGGTSSRLARGGSAYILAPAPATGGSSTPLPMRGGVLSTNPQVAIAGGSSTPMRGGIAAMRQPLIGSKLILGGSRRRKGSKKRRTKRRR